VSLGSSFAELLRSGCPVLEDLHLEDCCTEFNHIQSHTLKKLTIHICYRHSVGTLAIKAPALVELVLDPDLSMPEYTQKNEFSLADGSTNSLVDAWVVFPNDMSPRSRVMLLGSLSNVTKLELTACFSAEVYTIYASPFLAIPGILICPSMLHMDWIFLPLYVVYSFSVHLSLNLN
jgi:hypothetical protein